jgi:hypothetical protein
MASGNNQSTVGGSASNTIPIDDTETKAGGVNAKYPLLDYKISGNSNTSI